MRGLLFGLSCMVFACHATKADAAGLGKNQEILEFIAETAILETSGDALALCSLVRERTVFGTRVLSTSKGYALATNRCEANAYYPFSTVQLANAQSAGFISKDIPSKSWISRVQPIWKYVLLTLIGLVIVLAGRTRIKEALDTAKQRRQTKAVGAVARNTLDAMCHVAKVDGTVDKAEIKLIVALNEELNGDTFTADQIHEMIERSDANLPPSGFSRFTKGLQPSDYCTIMRACLMVAAADGTMTNDERRFISTLSSKLQISDQEVANILRQLVGKKRQSAAQPA